MTDVPPDTGASGREPDAPSDQPVIRRSNYAAPPPDAPPPNFDDDALAEAMAAEVRPYTEPIRLPEAPPAPPVAADPAAASPSPAAPTSAPAPQPSAPTPEPDLPTGDQPTEEELLRSLGSASTLEAIELLEKRLQRISAAEAAQSGSSTTASAPPASDAAPAAPGPEPALDHPAPGHFFPPAFEPIVHEPAQEPPAAAPAAPPSSAILPEVDESLIDPVAAAQLQSAVEPERGAEPAPSGTQDPWWEVSEPPGTTWNLAEPEAEPAAPAPAAPAPAAPEPAAAEPAAPEPAAPEPAAPELPPPAPEFVAPHLDDWGSITATPVPISTEPPVGPESPDWLDAPPPVFEPPELIEPPEPNEPTREAAEPITPIDMAQLPMPTELPKLEDRAELPPPPGYHDVPLRAADAAGAPPPSVPYMFSSAETSTLDHNEDDVIDAVDRVGGTGAIPASGAGTADPLSPPSEPIATVRLADGEPAMVDKKAQQPSAFEVETAGAEPTALDRRAGRAARLFWLWFAANSSVLSLGLGAVLLSTGMSLRQAIVATLAGVAISFLPLGLGTLAGKWSGQPTMVVSRATFGHVGNILPALLALATRVLWGGVLLWLLSTAVAQVLVGSGLDAGLGTTVWQLVGLVAGFLIATVIAVFGYGFVARLQLVLSILSALLIVGAGVLTYQHLDFMTALRRPDGSWILVISGAALVFSVIGLAWVHSSSDLARYQRPASYGGSSMLWATFGATLPPFALIAWGAMLAASDPDIATGLTTNPLAAIASLLPLWYPAPLLAAAGIGLLSGAVLTMYSGGFALQALGVKVRRGLGTFAVAVLVLAAAGALLFVVSDLSSLLRDLVVTVAVPVAAWAGIFAAEMMIRTRRFHAPSLLAPGGVYPRVRVLNLLAWLIISAIGLGLVTSQIPWLGWEGFGYGLLGIGPHDLLASSDAGVFVALLLGILVPLIGGVPAIRRQERAVVPE